MVAADFQAPAWRLEQTMRAFLCVLTLFLIAGCSGGGGGNITGPGNPPIIPDPPPAAKFWTVSGTADFGPTVTRPGVILATQSQEGILEPVVYGEKMATIAIGPAASQVSLPFSLKVPLTLASGDYHLASYDDTNADGKYDQTELVGDWSFLLSTDGKALSVVDAFGDVVEGGADAKKYTISIAAQYRR